MGIKEILILLFVAAAAYELVSRIRFLLIAKTTQATIMEPDAVKDAGISEHLRRITFAGDGRTYEARKLLSPQFKEGQVITIRYDPRDPENMRKIKLKWFATWVTILGFVLVTIGLIECVADIFRSAE